MKIVFFGSGPFGILALEALKKSSHEVSLVVTGLSKPKGRNLRVLPTPLKESALKLNLPSLEVSEVRSEDFLEKLREIQADVFVVISFGFLLPEKLLEIPKKAALNVHSSLLPRHRGAAPIHWAILEGDKESGVTVMRMAKKLDAGDILLQKKTPIENSDDVISLERRLSLLGAEALLEALELIGQGRAAFMAQDESRSTYARKLAKQDGLIRWNRSVREILGQIRALKSWPGAYAFIGRKRILVLDAEAHPGVPGAAPGTVLRASGEEGIVIAAADGALKILSLKLEGRSALGAGEFLNGFPISAGQVFE